MATPFGIALAWLLARRDFWGKSVLDALVHLPLVLPPVVTGYLLLLTFGRRGLVGAWLADNLGIVFAFRWTGAALACGVMSFPLLVRPIRLSIEAIDRRLEQAASTLGAAPWRVFATVTLPLALPGVLAGMVLGFAKAIGEFGATITFVSNIPGETQTISSAIYSLIQTPDGDTAAGRLVLISIVIAMGALIASEWFARRATQAPARELTMLRVDVTKQLGEFSLEASFTSEGRVTGLFGASGAGKTSLINMIAGLLRPDRGVIALDGETLDDTAAGVHVPPHRRRIGYVFQDARLFPHLDVRQNLDYGRRMNRLAEDPAQRSARHRSARYRPPARPPSRPALRRRAPARRARPRAVVEAAPAAAGRAAGIARRGPQGRDPALSGAAARRRHSDGLCQPRRRRTAPARDADRDAATGPRDRARRRQGADVGDDGS